jgi:hypothetical protein
MGARLTQAPADAFELSDREPPARQGVEGDPARHDVAPGLRRP